MTAAEVILWKTRIGTVVFDDDTGTGAFEYDSAFLRSGIEVSPVVMPLLPGIYRFPGLARESFHGLPGLLADSLPDKFGNSVINAWLSSQGRSPDTFNPVERLCYTGSRGMGALEYIPARGPADAESGSIQIERLVLLASEILRSRENLKIHADEGAMEEIIKVGTSAGGARAKAVIAWNEKTGDIRSGQIDAGEGYGYWLLKFDGISGNADKESEDDPQYTRIEYAYWMMARKAGIDMSECRLHRENSRFHFMTRRFDRDPLTGDKIHMQTLGGIAHFDFNLPGVYSYVQAAQIMRRLRCTASDTVQLFRRMVFNVLARNQDDHVKNISFLMNRAGKWRLAPAYDVTYAYNPQGIWTGTHQMLIHGKRDHIDHSDLIADAESMGIRKSEAEKIIKEVRDALSGWMEYAETAQLRRSATEAIQKTFVLI